MRARPRRVVKLLFVTSIIGFTLINLTLFLDNSRHQSTPGSPEAGAFASSSNDDVRHADYAIPVRHLEEHFQSNNNSNKLQQLPDSFESKLNNNNNNLSKSNHDLKEILTFNKKQGNSAAFPAAETADVNLTALTRDVYHTSVGTNPSAIKEYIARVNAAQLIRNSDRFDLPSGNDALVIVVQVHDRTEYLKLLIDSLRTAKGIENTLLVFSHDYFSDDVNKLIYEIDFCPVSKLSNDW